VFAVTRTGRADADPLPHVARMPEVDSFAFILRCYRGYVLGIQYCCFVDITAEELCNRDSFRQPCDATGKD
jgi:hypothetical protein